MNFTLKVTHAGTGNQSEQGAQILDNFNCSVDTEIKHEQVYQVRPFAQLGIYQKHTKVKPKVESLTFGYVVEDVYWHGGDEDCSETRYFLNGNEVSEKRYKNTKKTFRL